MKKLISTMLTILLALTFCACRTNHDGKTRDGKEADNVSWSDYNVGAVSNLTNASFADEEGKYVDSNNKQDKVEIIVEPLCPYCKCDRWADVIKLDDLPIEELGNQTVLYETTTKCLDWDKHWDTSEFNISILLTLN